MTATAISPSVEDDALVLTLGPLAEKLTDDDFLAFCQANECWRIERTSEREVVIMPPIGTLGGNYESLLIGHLTMWTVSDGRGLSFSSSALFRLPNGAIRSPDFAWVERSRWEALPKSRREKIAPICPDFVVELRSPTDSVARLQAKMEECLANGAQLGWLIDPIRRRVYVYRPTADVVQLEDPKTLSGDPEHPGLVLELENVCGT